MVVQWWEIYTRSHTNYCIVNLKINKLVGNLKHLQWQMVNNCYVVGCTNYRVFLEHLTNFTFYISIV